MTRTTKVTTKAKASATTKTDQQTNVAPEGEQAEQQTAEVSAGRKFETSDALAHFIQHDPEFGTLPLDEQNQLRGQLLDAKRAEAVPDGHWPDGRKRLTLTDGDAQADLEGSRRPDNHVN